jgi:hypothetical protein
MNITPTEIRIRTTALRTGTSLRFQSSFIPVLPESQAGCNIIDSPCALRRNQRSAKHRDEPVHRLRVPANAKHHSCHESLTLPRLRTTYLPVLPDHTVLRCSLSSGIRARPSRRANGPLVDHPLRRYLYLLVFTASHHTPTSGHQVEDQDHHCDDQQKVDQGAADVKAEAEKPQNQHNHENCPKHMSPRSLFSTLAPHLCVNHIALRARLTYALA